MTVATQPAIGKTIFYWAALVTFVVLTLYMAWILMTAGEQGIGLIVLAISLSAAVIFASPKLYTQRFVFPGILAVLIFILVPVLYTSYLGFTNYGGRNLLDFDSATKYHLALREVDQDNEQAFNLVRSEQGFQIWLPDQSLLSEPFMTGHSEPLATSSAETPENLLSVRDVVQNRSLLQEVSIDTPDGVLRASGLRSFAPITPVYEQVDDNTLRNRSTGELLIANHETGFYEFESGEQIAPGWKVHVGWANFARVLGSESIRAPMVTIFIWTMTFAFLSMLFTFAVGLVLAMVLQWEHLRGKAIYRVMLILPYAVPAFISILVFRGLFNQNFGEINFILSSIFGIKPAWFTDPTLARAMTLIVNTWLGYPYMMLLAMGYLQSIPQDHYKAAALEGASPVRTFFTITLPQLLPPFAPLLIANFAFNFNNIVLILLLTSGLPDIPGTTIQAGYTDLLGSFTYRISFLDSGQNFGLAGAVTSLIFIVVAVIAYVNFIALSKAANAKGTGR
ncbi:maltose ABC transporter permease MalF [Salinibius halmophilus]|uniref:maltose ABC transporter permease MalF n=1 Tax=Salinibius halmophilus TaxID=1853216 RepID=UPI000E65F15E|nr:maltose ABC transporter permease MalF [Salinibius halmophilus]